MRSVAFAILLLPAIHRCDTAKDPATIAPNVDTAPSVLAAPSPPDPVRIEKVSVPNDLPAYVLRGDRAHRIATVFIPGMCVHPEGYVMAFAHAAAAHGELLTVQGDVACAPGSPFRRWSNDLEAMDRRIDAAFRAAELGPPAAIVLIGYSQGAERAEKLMARFPRKYTSAILIASPITPSPRLLGRAETVALMSGTLDGAYGSMRDAAQSLKKANVRSAFFAIPNARHGQLGDHPDESIREALDFIDP